MTSMRDKIAKILKTQLMLSTHDERDIPDAADAIIELVQARIDNLEQVLRDMVDLFSADDMLLKGTHLHAPVKQARAARAALKGSDK